mmetsp:Transcript_1738/g.4063  ORF Transcript_1738/g.4063 Transcript_1738/m.4063 type:complete len:247 (+) Transcript_1738:705-1445(+)
MEGLSTSRAKGRPLPRQRTLISSLPQGCRRTASAGRYVCKACDTISSTLQRPFRSYRISLEGSAVLLDLLLKSLLLLLLLLFLLLLSSLSSPSLSPISPLSPLSPPSSISLSLSSPSPAAALVLTVQAAWGTSLASLRYLPSRYTGQATDDATQRTRYPSLSSGTADVGSDADTNADAGADADTDTSISTDEGSDLGSDGPLTTCMYDFSEASRADMPLEPWVLHCDSNESTLFLDSSPSSSLVPL